MGSCLNDMTSKDMSLQRRVNASQRVYKMRSFQEKLSIFTRNSTNLLIQIAELNELREQLRKAQQSAPKVPQSKRRKRMPIEYAAHP
jgi:uncharacterized protein YydD (DUF2326 family)